MLCFHVLIKLLSMVVLRCILGTRSLSRQGLLWIMVFMETILVLPIFRRRVLSSVISRCKT